jgi:hypothetical protein
MIDDLRVRAGSTGGKHVEAQVGQIRTTGVPVWCCSSRRAFVLRHPWEQLSVTAKGQVTLRKDVLRNLGVTPGQKVEIDLLLNGRLDVRAAKSGASIDSFIGCRYRPVTNPLTIEEIGGDCGRRLSGSQWIITVDTNVLLQAALLDDPEQAQRAARSSPASVAPRSG